MSLDNERSHVVGGEEAINKKPYSLEDEITLVVNTYVNDDLTSCFYSQVDDMVFLVNRSTHWEFHPPRYLSQGSCFFSVTLPDEAYQQAFDLFQQQRAVRQFICGQWLASDINYQVGPLLALTEACSHQLTVLFDQIQALEKDKSAWSLFCNALEFLGPRLTKKQSDQLLIAGFSPGHQIVRSFQLNQLIVSAVSQWRLRDDIGLSGLLEEMKSAMMQPQRLVKDRCLALYDSFMQLVAQLGVCKQKALRQAMISIVMEASLCDWLSIEDQQYLISIFFHHRHGGHEEYDVFVLFEWLCDFVHQLGLLGDSSWLPLSHDLMTAFQESIDEQPINQLFQRELNEETMGILSYLLNKEKDKGSVVDNLLTVFCQFFANHFSYEQMQWLYKVKSCVGHEILDVNEMNHLVFQLGVKLERSSDTTLQSLSLFLLNQYYLKTGADKIPLQCLRTYGDCFRIGLDEGISQLIAVPEFSKAPPHYVTLLRETAQFEAVLAQYQQQFSVLISLFFPDKKLSLLVHKFTFKKNDLVRHVEGGLSHDSRVSAPFIFYAVDSRNEPSATVLRMLLSHLFRVSSNALVARSMKADAPSQCLFLSHVYYHQLINEKFLIVDAMHQHQPLKLLAYHDLNTAETLLMACLLGVRVEETAYVTQLFSLLFPYLHKKVSLHDKQATRICYFLLDHPTLRQQPLIRAVHDGVSQLRAQDAEFSAHLAASPGLKL